jgi:hypothetical protein
MFRNICIAAISAAWIIPLYGCLSSFLEFMRKEEAELKIYTADYPDGPPFSNVELSQWFLGWTAILFAVCIFLWALIVINRIWPLKSSENRQKEHKLWNNKDV